MVILSWFPNLINGGFMAKKKAVKKAPKKEAAKKAMLKAKKGK